MGRFLQRVQRFIDPEGAAIADTAAWTAHWQDAEMRERERYWFEHPFEFSCPVRWSEPRERTARMGAYLHGGGPVGVFGSVPVPFHGEFTDKGTFQVHHNQFVFLGEHCSRVIPFAQIINVTWFDDGGVQIHCQGVRSIGAGLVTVQGPVRAPVISALMQTGILPPGTYNG